MNTIASYIKTHTAGFVGIVAIVALIAGGVYYLTHQHNMVCPEEMIVNQMPAVDRSGETVSDEIPMRSNYYIIDGKRVEIDELDTAWIASNCRVPVTEVQ
jgi:hypothetical protein